MLDTHAALWMTEEGKLTDSAETELRAARSDGAAIMVSPITAWEIGMLVARGRLALSMAPSQWFDALVDSGLELSVLSPEILISSSFLPDGLGGDPADRILAATARACSYRLMTRDRALLRYAELGHLNVIPC